MWEKPWTREDVEGRPWVDGVSLGSGVDCLRGVWDEEERAMVLSLRTWDGRKQTQGVSVKALHSVTWAVYVDGELVRIVEVSVQDKGVSLEVEVSGEPVDIVLIETGKH